VLKTEEKNKEDKSEIILNAAQKRFSIYGVEKTSMREIADDVNMSKASLYYYFPDKESLYLKVIEKEQSEFLKSIMEDIRVISDPGECLRKYAIKRLSYFRTLLNLGRLKVVEIYGLKPVLASTLARFSEEERKLVARILDSGRQSGQFGIQDIHKTAVLFLDLLKGLRSGFMTNKEITVINDSEYEALCNKVADITDIFIKGLMYSAL
jgi:TetR/AcrR family transcriptional regulator